MASEWLYTCPDDVLDRLLHGSGPGTPHSDVADDAPVLAPRRVTTLQVHQPPFDMCLSWFHPCLS